MQNIPSELIITVKNYINITSFKMKGSPDLGQAEQGKDSIVNLNGNACKTLSEVEETKFVLSHYFRD